jgi:hypothetical protein
MSGQPLMVKLVGIVRIGTVQTKIDMKLSGLSYSALPWKRCTFALPGLAVAHSPSPVSNGRLARRTLRAA